MPEHWIVDVPGRALLVHRDPQGERCAAVVRLADGVSVQPLLDVAPVAVTALLDE